MDDDKGFNHLVLLWVKDHLDDDADEILEMVGRGNDWEGGTEEGFYRAFRVDIRYKTADGKIKYVEVDGTDMGSLWNWVVKGFGDRATDR